VPSRSRTAASEFARYQVQRELHGCRLAPGLDRQDALPLDSTNDALGVQSNGQGQGFLHILPFRSLRFTADLEINQVGQGRQRPRRRWAGVELETCQTAVEDLVYPRRAADLHVELSRPREQANALLRLERTLDAD